MPARAALRAGDRVAVPWGVDTRDGEISAVYQTGDVERVLVRLDPTESTEDEPQTVLFPADAVKLLSEEPDLPAPGTWLRGFRYERDVGEALSRVLATWEPKIRLNAEISGKEIDALVESPQGILIVEVKVSRELSGHSFDRAVRQLHAAMGTFPAARGLLVTPSALPASVASGGLLSPTVGVVRWRGAKDDRRLQRVTHALFNEDLGGLHDVATPTA